MKKIEDKIYECLCGGIRKSTWEDYTLNEKRGYIRNHPNSQYGKTEFEKEVMKSNADGFCIIINREKVICFEKEQTVYDAKKYVRMIMNNPNNKYYAIQKLSYIADWEEQFQEHRLFEERKKMYKSKFNVYLLVFGEFEI